MILSQIFLLLNTFQKLFQTFDIFAFVFVSWYSYKPHTKLIFTANIISLNLQNRGRKGALLYY